jgi:hypothetical protein
MGVSSQCHAPAALYPREKDPRLLLEAGWVSEVAWTVNVINVNICKVVSVLEYHDMKTMGHGGNAPRIPNLCTQWR